MLVGVGTSGIPEGESSWRRNSCESVRSLSEEKQLLSLCYYSTGCLLHNTTLHHNCWRASCWVSLDRIESERRVFITCCDLSLTGNPWIKETKNTSNKRLIWLKSDAVATQQETDPAASQTFSQQFVCWHHERVWKTSSDRLGSSSDCSTVTLLSCFGSAHFEPKLSCVLISLSINRRRVWIRNRSKKINIQTAEQNSKNNSVCQNTKAANSHQTPNSWNTTEHYRLLTLLHTYSTEKCYKGRIFKVWPHQLHRFCKYCLIRTQMLWQRQMKNVKTVQSSKKHLFELCTGKRVHWLLMMSEATMERNSHFVNTWM